MNWIDRAETRFGHLAIPRPLHAIALLSAFAYVMYKVHPDFFQFLAMNPYLVLRGEVWRLVTYIFIPNIFSFIPLPTWLNAAFYVMFMFWLGNGLEQAIGAFKLNVFCLLTLVGITVAAFFFGAYYSQAMFVQAIFFAFARYYPEEIIYMFLVLPVKVKWSAWVSAFLLIFFILMTGGYLSAFAGAFSALIAYFIFFGREIVEDSQHRQKVTARRLRFEKAVEQADGETMHRCKVCGRTENDADLEFRVAKDGEEYCTEHLPKPTPPVA